MPETCEICDGVGLRVVERDGGIRVAQVCECREVLRDARKLERTRIPERHRHCTFEDYYPHYAGKNKSFARALVMARKFVEGYPLDTDGQGLLLVGGYGVGKTHLAVSMLRELVIKKGASGIFCDYRALLKQIQDSYGREDVSERQVLAPVFEADVLVLDELGAAKPTDWVWDTVQHILNTRYNDRKTTIITTNYRNERELPMGYWDDLPKDKRDAVKAMYRDNLGDRITERMRSRLLEMCVVVEMEGPDFRESVGRATFSGGNGRGSDVSTEDVEAKAEIARVALEIEAQDRILREMCGDNPVPSRDDEITGARSLARYAGK